jgi:hypothetical protein
MVNLKALFHYNRYYYLLVVLPTLSNHIGLVLSSHLASPPYPRTESTLGTRDSTSLYRSMPEAPCHNLHRSRGNNLDSGQREVSLVKYEQIEYPAYSRISIFIPIRTRYAL